MQKPPVSQPLWLITLAEEEAKMQSFCSLLPELVEEALAESGVEDGAKVILKNFVSLLL